MPRKRMAGSRRVFLQRLAAAAAGTHFLGVVTAPARGGGFASPMNILLILTDQERPPMWLPAEWEAANLPNTTRLKNNGLTFTQAFCATAMCTPSRNALFTGLFPTQHHAHSTLTEDFLQTPLEPQLDPSLPNLATCLKEAGYDVVYKGKWHMSQGIRGVDGVHIEDDISRYGFDGWDPPDAGGDTGAHTFGGGTADHDTRYINDAKAYLQNRVLNPSGRPFCLIVSLVNPHDVLAYPGAGNPEPWLAGGYDSSWLGPTTPPIPLPPTVNENLTSNHKPAAHAAVKLVMGAGLGAVGNPQTQQNYLNFYGNLMKKVDGQIGELLAVFDRLGPAGAAALNNTVIIRTSDHGENALCHGGLRQKAFVTYEETVRVPMIWSNPALYPTARTTRALVSHVDLLPTLCALTGAPNWQAKGFTGVDYSSIVLNPAAPAVQDYILFTFDDVHAATNAARFPNGPVPPPNRIRMIRTSDFKYARYFDAAGVVDDQQECYDLRPGGGDFSALYGLPLEERNISNWAEARRALNGQPTLADAAQVAARTVLMSQLATLEGTRLAPRAWAPPVSPEQMQFAVKRWTDPANGPQVRAQLTFLSRIGATYQLQKSADLVVWSNLGAPLAGNNGPVLMSDTVTEEKAFYRVQWA